MDNETSQNQVSSRALERLVIFISDIIEKITDLGDIPIIIRTENFVKEGNYIKQAFKLKFCLFCYIIIYFNI